MKKIILVSSLLFAFLSANANETKQFDTDSLQLLTAVFNNCPVQFIQAMKGANRVGKASYSSDRQGESYSITTVGGGYAPSFQSHAVATLEIVRTVARDTTHVPNRPTQWTVSCQLTNHE